MGKPPDLTARAARAARRAWRRSTAAELAAPQGGVVHRGQLRAVGIGRDDVRAEVDAGRWSMLGRHTVLLGDPAALGVTDGQGPPDWPARPWWAVWESGSRAVLVGASALVAAGLTGWREDTIHVSLPGNSTVHRLPGIRPHVLRTVVRKPGCGIPRAPVETAVIHAAQWAASDRRAATLIAMTVQQRLLPARRLLAAWRGTARSARRPLIDVVIRDVCDGAQSMGEIDFAGACRRYGLPAPTRQAVKTTASGRVYLDVWW